MQVKGGGIVGVDWEEHWRSLVRQRGGHGERHGQAGYWDRRAPSYARITRGRADEFLAVIAQHVGPRKTLIDAGAGAGRHAAPLADVLEWVTAVEPSEGMRAQIPRRDNMTVIASTWEDAQVAPAHLVISCHVLYGVEEPVPFIAKLEASARERVFVMLREGDAPHPAIALRARLLGAAGPRQPGFSDLFMLLLQMGIAPDVTFVRYPVVHRYPSFDEAVEDCAMLIGDGWDTTRGPELLREMLVRDGDELTYDSGVALAGIAHWQPRTS